MGFCSGIIRGTMLLLVVFLICLFVAVGTGVLSALSDVRGLVIPNIYSVVVMGAFVVAYGALWVFGHGGVFQSLVSHILSALVVFLVTLIMFAMRGIGAADSKLATAYAFWVGMAGFLPFLLYMSLFGGVLGLTSLLLRKFKPFKSPSEGSWAAQVQAGESKVPYGVAIVFGALVSFVKLGYLSGGVLASFLAS